MTMIGYVLGIVSVAISIIILLIFCLLFAGGMMVAVQKG